mgnify:FL=1
MIGDKRRENLEGIPPMAGGMRYTSPRIADFFGRMHETRVALVDYILSQRRPSLK